MEIKKSYESKKEYGKKYNKINKSIQINRDLINKLQFKLNTKEITLKSYIEDLISNNLDKLV